MLRLMGDEWHGLASRGMRGGKEDAGGQDRGWVLQEKVRGAPGPWFGTAGFV